MKKLKIGDMLNGWTIIDRLPKGEWKAQCPFCIETRIYSRYYLQRRRSCGCQKKKDGTACKTSIGDLVNGWKILERGPKGVWKVQCSFCPQIRNYSRYYLERVYSCGCQVAHLKIGDEIGNWKILENATERGLWKAQCKCGAERLHGKSALIIINSCGCMKRQDTIVTCLERYGVEYPNQHPPFKIKTKETCLKRYGVDSATKTPEVLELMRQTCQERYGVNHYRNTAESKRRAGEYYFKLYGCESYFQTEEFRIKSKQAMLERYGVEVVTQLPEYRYNLRQWNEENFRYGFSSKGELEILSWIQIFYPDAKKYKTEGNELDIFIPEINLGIEYNGLYWHNESRLEKRGGKNYHLYKTKFFKEKGIRVIHIFEHEWKNSQEQVKSFIQSAIGKNSNKIGARKCSFTWTDLKEDKKEVREFLDTYHIQGRCNFAYAIKVTHEDQLIGVATFGKHHRNSTDWVLSRFCTKQSYTIQGGLAKIGKLAYQQLQQPLISWAHYRISDGNGYLKAGWKYEELLKPDYFYHKGIKVISKQSRQKKIVSTPKNMTEKEHAKLDGLERVWDCGKIRFKYNS